MESSFSWQPLERHSSLSEETRWSDFTSIVPSRSEEEIKEVSPAQLPIVIGFGAGVIRHLLRCGMSLMMMMMMMMMMIIIMMIMMMIMCRGKLSTLSRLQD